MNLVFKKVIVPICIGIMLGSQLMAYFLNKDVNLFHKLKYELVEIEEINPKAKLINVKL